ncbi:MAG: arsenic resistance N-acetyltransferase ArsN2 [Gemmatimonadales bacterium]
MTNEPGIVIEAAEAAELPAVLELLDGVQLPGEDLENHLDGMLVARRSDRVVGSATLELYGKSALLRSVVVDPGLQGRGLGVGLTRAALDLARERGVVRVYLLTETAGEFFPRFGFRSVARSEVAPEVRQSVEFGSVCPDTALVMQLDLEQ